MNTSKTKMLPKFLVVTGLSLSLSCTFYVLIVSLYGLQFSGSVFWFFAGSISMFLFITLALRFFVLKVEFEDIDRSASRVLMITYGVFALLGVSFIYGRMHWHSLPVGKRIYKNFQENQNKAISQKHLRL